MDKEFNRSMAREISRKIQEVLSTQCKDWDYELSVNGGSFTADKLKLNLEIRIKNSDGTLAVSDTSHYNADSAAKRVGLKLEGHLIGSMWLVGGEVYTVTEYTTKRPRYPLSLKRGDGQVSKASIMFLSTGIQLNVPSLEEFTKWFTMDPDSDAILEADAEICDEVQKFMWNSFPEEDGNKFFELVDALNAKGIAEKYAKRAYELLFVERLSIHTAYLGLKLQLTKDTK